MSIGDTSEDRIRRVFDACSDCEVCREIMEDSCLLLAEIFRLQDRERETGQKPEPPELLELIDRCNLCGLCPCPDIRGDIMAAKSLRTEREGLPPGVRLMQDVDRLGKICGAFPRVNGFLTENRLAQGLLKQLLGVHEDRRLPVFSGTSFAERAAPYRSRNNAANGAKLKVAYFVGCTARNLFPEVALAGIRVLEANGIGVYVPDQRCCGMPTLLEGDRKKTFGLIRFNLTRLLECVEDGFTIVCSCPTCGYMIKQLLLQGACFAPAYQEAIGADPQMIQIPETGGATDRRRQGFIYLPKSIYGNVLKDDGYFSSIDPLARIRAAENTYDLGEYLLTLRNSGRFQTPVGTISDRLVYYSPCHLREQKIGTPFPELIDGMPGVDMAVISGSLYCCGMSGIMGFKRKFHDASLRLGRPLVDRIRSLAPERVVTDCLSCRLQFHQQIASPVSHPVEVLHALYEKS